MAEPLPPQTPPSDGAPSTPTPEEPPRKSLREIAEEAYDQVEAEAEGVEDPDDDQASVDEGGVRRDARGRFARAEPGEAADEGQPSPDDDSGTQQPEGHTQPPPADQAGRSSEAPANWSADDRAMFAKLPQEGRDFLTRRHSEMESDYQRRVQATSAAAQFAEALAPVFGDPVISGSLQQAGMLPHQAILEWGSFHKRAMSPNPADRIALLTELAQRMGLNPAAQGQPPPGVSPEDMKDPVVRFLTDQVAQALNASAELRGQLQTMQQGQAQAAAAQNERVVRWGIDSFADEKGKDGKPLRPYFDRVIKHTIELYKANPERDLQEAYEMACYMDPTVRAEILASQQSQAAQSQANQRAAQAARLNTRGRTVPVVGSRPNGSGEQPMTLRETIEASADEVGF